MTRGKYDKKHRMADQPELETEQILSSEDLISRRQLTRMIYVEGFGAAGLSYPAAAAWSGPGEGGWAFLAYAAFLLLFTEWLLWMIRKYMTEGEMGGAERGSFLIGHFPRWAILLYIIRFLITAAFLCCFFGSSVHEIYMPDHSLWWLLLPFGLLLWYCAQTNLQKHARFIELIFPWVAVLSIILILIVAAGILTDLSTFQFINAGIPGTMGDILDMVNGGCLLLLCSSSLEFLFFLVPACALFIPLKEEECSLGQENSQSQENSQGQKNRLKRGYCPGPEKQFPAYKEVHSAVIRGVAGGYICNLFLWFVTVKTLGRELTASSPWPVIKLMQIVRLPGGVLERFDILLALYWVLCLTGVLSGYLYYTRRLAEAVFFQKETAGTRRKKMALWTGLVVLAIYFTACLLPGLDHYMLLYMNYKKWVDFPLLLFVPILLGPKGPGFRQKYKRAALACRRKKSRAYGRKFILTVSELSPNHDRLRKIRGLMLMILLLLCTSCAVGCQKQSDAEKKRFILSLYVEIREQGYRFVTADADLAAMGEKEEWIPCRITEIKAGSFAEMEERFKRVEVGEPEWNHIDTIFIGPELSKHPEKMFSFLKEWDRAWQKSPNVTVCISALPSERIYEAKEAPDGIFGQQAEDLIEQMDSPATVRRTPIQILKAHYDKAGPIRVFYVHQGEKGLDIRSGLYSS